MPLHPQDVTRAVEKLYRIIGEDLDNTVWRRQPLQDEWTSTFTCAIRNGIVATAELTCLPVDSRQDWPVGVNLILGVGYQLAIDLMTVLDLPSDVALVPNPITVGRHNQPVAELGGEGDVLTAAKKLSAIITRSAAPFAERFADAEALLSARYTNPELAGDNYEDALSIILLAATGKKTQTKSILEKFPPSGRPKSDYFDERRFAEKVRSWLDIGPPSSHRA